MELTETNTFMDLMAATTKHYWCSVKLLSVALTFRFLLGNTMKCLQHCVTLVYKDTPTSSSISQKKPSPLCDAFFFSPYSQQ